MKSVTTGNHIVIPGDDPPQLQGSAHLERLKAVGSLTLYKDRPDHDAEKLRRLQGANVMINSRSAVKWPGPLLRQLPDLKMITVCGIGTDSIDLAVARELGIVVCNIPGETAPIVAEHALALMFAVARKTWYLTDRIKRGQWKAPDNRYLRGSLLGVIGAGPIGSEMIRLGKAVGMKVQAWTFHPNAERSQALGVPFVSLEELVATSDVISLHVKLTEQTRKLIGRAQIERMKPGAILINTARGPVVDSHALADALNAGHLGGAGLDVFETEPVSANDPLIACDQVVLTPHVADQNPEGMEILNRGAVENVLAFLEGKPRNRV